MVVRLSLYHSCPMQVSSITFDLVRHKVNEFHPLI